MDDRKPSATTTHPAKGRGSPLPPMRRILEQVSKDFAAPGRGGLHPALIPGIGVEATRRTFSTNWWVFAIAAGFVVVFIGWGVIAPDGMGEVARAGLGWVSTHFGWLFTVLTIAVFCFMLVVGFGPAGGVRLGADDEQPEFSRPSWVAMLFSAGMGIGLLFFGPYEPLEYFLHVPPGFDAEPGTREAMHVAMAQVLFHWGPMAWAYYALVGGAIAYSAYRRGRSPLISSIFEPIFGRRTQGPLGGAIDLFAILVTLFGTAVSLGIGALQIGRGLEVVAGIGPVGNSLLIGIIAVLTCLFIISAVSGVKRGIRLLSNVNMLLASAVGAFVFIAGPTLFLLDFIPSAGVAFVGELNGMMMRSAALGPESAEFMQGWTTYYWAWWVSWTPFVGLFIAKISRGRTLREFVLVVIVVPSLVCLVWFATFGGTAMLMEQTGAAIASAGNPQDVMFAVLDHLPFGVVSSVIAMVSIVIFFVTSADSASIVMGSMSQQGRPEPARWVSVTWGVGLSGIAVVLLLAGGRSALDSLQALVTISALPFAIVVFGIMFAWGRDLATDPYLLRRKYAYVAIREGVRKGIEEHGDDFVFAPEAVEPDHGAGAWLNTTDPSLTEWYTEAIEVQLSAGEAAGRQASGEAAETAAAGRGRSPDSEPRSGEPREE
ncbi:MAG: BCCT family transporter [Pseudoclavibacter sp.]|nr:BCCT family transporter [Pseudoclavibacter sp.]